MQVWKTKKGERVFLNITQTSADIASYIVNGSPFDHFIFLLQCSDLPHRKVAQFSYRTLIKRVQWITLYVKKDSKPSKTFWKTYFLLNNCIYSNYIVEQSIKYFIYNCFLTKNERIRYHHNPNPHLPFHTYLFNFKILPIKFLTLIIFKENDKFSCGKMYSDLKFIYFRSIIPKLFISGPNKW